MTGAKKAGKKGAPKPTQKMCCGLPVVNGKCAHCKTTRCTCHHPRAGTKR